MNITPINFNNNINFQTVHKTKKPETTSRQQYNTISNCYYVPFCGKETGDIKLATQRQSKLKTLTDEEYISIVDDLAKKGFLNSGSSKFFMDTSYCENVPLKYMGAIPYCGYEDCSYSINSWLDGRMKDDKLCEQQAIDVISALDYSLNKIDEDYGKYNGIVYRKGRFSEQPNRYSSASMNLDPESYLFFANYAFANPYNIIYLKNGHKLNSMLKQYATSQLHNLAQEEDEVLIDKKSQFKLIQPESYDEETKQLINNYFNLITKNIHHKYPEQELKEKIKINVWKEV